MLKYRILTIPNNILTIPSNLKLIAWDISNPTIDEIIFEKNSRLNTIEESAFEGIKIKYIKIPNSVMFIKKNAFSDCTLLKSIHFNNSKDNILTIEENAFIYCTTLEKVFFDNPDNVVIQKNAFLGCTKLEKFNITLDEFKRKLIFGEDYQQISLFKPKQPTLKQFDLSKSSQLTYTQPTYTPTIKQFDKSPQPIYPQPIYTQPKSPQLTYPQLTYPQYKLEPKFKPTNIKSPFIKKEENPIIFNISSSSSKKGKKKKSRRKKAKKKKTKKKKTKKKKKKKKK